MAVTNSTSSSSSSCSLKEWLSGGSTNSDSSSTIYLLDGGVSTHLRDLYGRDFDYNELWSSSLLLTDEGKDIILQGHRDWLTSGSNILTTVTYQCFHSNKATTKLQQDDGCADDLLSTVTDQCFCSGTAKLQLESGGGGGDENKISGVKIDEIKMETMLQDGVQLAQKAIATAPDDSSSQHHYVVASMGCYGASLADGSEYTGNYPSIKCEQDLVEFHKHKTQVLLSQNPDGIALETVPALIECRAFITLMKELFSSSSEQQQATTTTTTTPACWISFSCRNGQQLNDGSELTSALQAIEELDPSAEIIHAIGINCFDSQYIPSLISILIRHMIHQKQQQQQQQQQQDGAVPHPTRGIVLYPNSGEEWDAETKTWREGTGLRTDKLQSVFATRLMEAVEIVDKEWNTSTLSEYPRPKIILGGCCRTRPETIQTLRTMVDQYHHSKNQIQQQQVSDGGAAMTAEQQRKLAAILGRDADFDLQLGEIGDSLQDLQETQQRQAESVTKQSSAIKRIHKNSKK